MSINQPSRPLIAADPYMLCCHVAVDMEIDSMRAGSSHRAGDRRLASQRRSLRSQRWAQRSTGF
jgi:hypothetical protein